MFGACDSTHTRVLGVMTGNKYSSVCQFGAHDEVFLALLPRNTKVRRAVS